MKTLLLVTVACGAAFGWSSLRAQDTEKLNSLDYVTIIIMLPSLMPRSAENKCHPQREAFQPIDCSHTGIENRKPYHTIVNRDRRTQVHET